MLSTGPVTGGGSAVSHRCCLRAVADADARVLLTAACWVALTIASASPRSSCQRHAAVERERTGRGNRDDGQPPTTWRRRTTDWRVITSHDAGVRGRTARASGASTGRRWHEWSATNFDRIGASGLRRNRSAVEPCRTPIEDAYDAYNRGDNATALRLFRPLADQGVASAQLHLGVMYTEGEGVPQDYVRAHMWFNLSAAQGEKAAARYRNIIAARMTPAQVAEAQKLAREWQPNRP